MFIGTVFSAGVVFCLEMMVALSCDVECGCCCRNASEWIKVFVHRQRPFVDGPFVDWSGYSCF